MAETKERLRETEEKEILVDVRKGEEQIPEGVEPWIERVERVKADDTGRQTLTAQGPVAPKITLPTTKQSFLVGLKKKVSDAGRWLSTFILRLIKIKKGNVEFKEEE